MRTAEMLLEGFGVTEKIVGSWETDRRSNDTKCVLEFKPSYVDDDRYSEKDVIHVTVDDNHNIDRICTDGVGLDVHAMLIVGACTWQYVHFRYLLFQETQNSKFERVGFLSRQSTLVTEDYSVTSDHEELEAVRYGSEDEAFLSFFGPHTSVRLNVI